MKFSILNTLRMGIGIFSLASALYVQAGQPTNDNSVKISAQEFQASIGLVSPRVKEKLKNGSFVTKPVIKSINDWQVNAIYLKAGIETIAKNTLGNEFTVVSEHLSKNASEINDFVQGKPNCCDVEGFETLDLLISQQNALIFDYTSAYIDQDIELFTIINQQLIETNNSIYIYLLNRLGGCGRVPNPDSLQIALATYLDSVLIEIQYFVEAINFGTGEFIPAYNAYGASLNSAEEVGRLIGKAVAYSE